LQGLHVDIVVDGEPAETPLQRLQSGLFAEIAPKSTKAHGVVIFSAPGESRECVEIARLVHREAESGVAFDQMAVLLRSPLQYRSQLVEAFRRAGIPAYFARGTARPDPAGRAFLALLACAAQGLSAARFAEYLSLGEVPDATEAGSPPAPQPEAERWVPADDELFSDAITETAPPEESGTETWQPDGRPVVAGTLRAPRLWERLIVDAAVIGGLDRWNRRLDGLRAELRMGLGELDPDDARAVGVRHSQEALEGLRAYALPLLEELAALPSRARWGDWLDRLGALATRALRSPSRVLSVIAELAPMVPLSRGCAGRAGNTVVP
jgi:hypothetical protein